jgi:hypothetical protein
MKYQQLRSAQISMGYHKMQELIDSGLVWRLEGSMGREASHLLEIGACMLPKRSYRDYYGNRIPSRDDLKKGSKGTYHNSLKFYRHETSI